jgi:hypothetical protein
MSNKVQVGFFSFTEITDPAEHRAYNEWHMLDHMPEQYPLDGIAYGQRWVATPACARARVVHDAPLDATHYLTLYLMTEPVERTLHEFLDLGRQLHALGRFHRERRSHLSGPLRVLEAAAAARVLVSADSIPYRPNRGVYVIVETPRDRAALAEYTRWLHTDHHDVLLAVPGVAGLWTFTTSTEFRDQPWDTGNQRITVVWLDDDPLAVAPKLDDVDAARRAREDIVRVTFAGPFETITPWQWDWFDERADG